jgi:hypothetical protein
MGAWGKGLAFEAPFPHTSAYRSSRGFGCQQAYLSGLFSSWLSVFLARVLRMDSPRSSMR